MIIPIIDFSLFANTLDIILYTPPTKLVGWKSRTSRTLCLFWYVALIFFTNFCRLCNSLKTAIMSSFITSQHLWRKAIVKPSGPCALSPFKSLTTSHTSCSKSLSNLLEESIWVHMFLYVFFVCSFLHFIFSFYLFFIISFSMKREQENRLNIYVASFLSHYIYCNFEYKDQNGHITY
jgi:hypothetical protein